jgi:hypothetical protein
MINKSMLFAASALLLSAPVAMAQNSLNGPAGATSRGGYDASNTEHPAGSSAGGSMRSGASSSMSQGRSSGAGQGYGASDAGSR